MILTMMRRKEMTTKQMILTMMRMKASARIVGSWCNSRILGIMSSGKGIACAVGM